MSIQIHDIINQLTREALNDNLTPTEFDSFSKILMGEIANGFFYLVYIDYERNNYKEYFDEPPSVYGDYTLDLLSPQALAAYNKDRQDYPELFI
jgi:hypothetical protein